MSSTIGNLAAVTTLSSGDIFPLVHSGANKKITFTDLVKAAVAGVTDQHLPISNGGTLGESGILVYPDTGAGAPGIKLGLSGAYALLYGNNSGSGMLELSDGSGTVQINFSGIYSNGLIVGFAGQQLIGADRSTPVLEWGRSGNNLGVPALPLHEDAMSGGNVGSLWLDTTCGYVVRVVVGAISSSLDVEDSGFGSHVATWSGVAGYTEQLQMSDLASPENWANVAGAVTSPYDTTPDAGTNKMYRVQYVKGLDVRYSQTVSVGT